MSRARTRCGSCIAMAHAGFLHVCICMAQAAVSTAVYVPSAHNMRAKHVYVYKHVYVHTHIQKLLCAICMLLSCLQNL